MAGFEVITEVNEICFTFDHVNSPWLTITSDAVFLCNVFTVSTASASCSDWTITVQEFTACLSAREQWLRTRAVRPRRSRDYLGLLNTAIVICTD